MALARTDLIRQNFVNSAGITTSSFTPPANSLLVVSVSWSEASQNVSAGLTITNTGGLTFTSRGGQNPQGPTKPSGDLSWQQIWTAPVGTSPAAQTVTVRSTPNTSNGYCEIHIVAYTGYDTGGSPIGATAMDGTPSATTSSSFSLTLSAAPATSSVVFASLAVGPVNVGGPVTVGTGWTEIYDVIIGDPGLQSQQRTGSTSTNVIWDDVDTSNVTNGLYACGGIAIEIKEGGDRLVAIEAPDTAAFAGDVSGNVIAAIEAPDVAAINGAITIEYQYLGVGTVVEVTAVSHTLSLTGIAARQAGDLLVACIGSRTTATTSVSLPSGWTLVNEQRTNNTLTTTGAIASGVMAYIVRGASDPALTFTHPAGISVSRGTIAAYRPRSPMGLDVSSAATTATNTTSVSVTGLTTTMPTDLLVAMAVGGQEAAWSNFDAVTDPTTTSGTGSAQTGDPALGTWQERSDTNTTTGADMSLAVADALKGTAGATGNFTATASLGAGHVMVVGAFKFFPRGDLNPTEDADVAALAGTVGAASGVSGTLNTTEAADTAAITGQLGVVGTFAATEAADIAAITGQLGVVGTLATTEAVDTAAINGTVNWNATLAATEAADTAVINGSIAWTATLAATETRDTALINGGIFGSGTLAVTETPDTALINGGIFGTGTLGVTEAPDTAAFSGSLAGAGVSGSLAVTEAADTAVINGSVTGTIGTLVATETPDVAAIAGTIAWNGTLAATEAKDTAALSGTDAWNAILAATEAQDAILFNGTVTTPAATGTLNATEARDTAAITGSIVLSAVTGILTATELADTAQIIAQTRGDAPGVLHFGRRVTINRW